MKQESTLIREALARVVQEAWDKAKQARKEAEETEEKAWELRGRIEEAAKKAEEKAEKKEVWEVWEVWAAWAAWAVAQEAAWEMILKAWKVETTDAKGNTPLSDCVSE